MPVGAVPPSTAGDNHALLVDFGGFAEIEVPAAAVAEGPTTIAARFVLQYPRGFYGWVLGESSSGTFLIGKESGVPRLLVDAGSGAVLAGDELPAGRWIHVAVVIDGSLVTIYLDGDEVGRFERASDATAPREGTMRLGTRSDAFPGEQLVGLVDDVWIVREALDATAVELLARGQSPPADAHVLAGFTFEPGGPLPRMQGAARVIAAPLTAPPPAIGPSHVTELRLPVDGAWRVVQGYEGWSHEGYAAFALDLIPVEPEPAEGAPLASFPCFGRELRAPADGVVLEAGDEARDPPGYVRGQGRGNFLVLEHAPGEISELVHLQEDSVPLRPGDRVRQGEVIGRCGNTGSAGTPHVHWALLWSAQPVRTRPARFGSYEVLGDDGTWRPGSGTPVAGEVIRSLPEALQSTRTSATSSILSGVAVTTR